MNKKFFFFVFLIILFFSCKNDFTLHEHTFEDQWTSDINYHWHKATCEHEEEIIKDRAPHVFEDWIIITDSTEIEEGIKERTCSICDYKETVTITKKEHTHLFEETWTSNVLYHWHKTICEHDEEVISSRAEHSFTEWEITKEASEVEDGLKERSCTICGYIEKEVISPFNHVHSFEETWSNDASFHWHKSSCEHIEEVITDRAEHSYGDWIITKPATSISIGEKERECSVCHYVEKKQVFLCVTHNWDNGIVTKESSCTLAGIRTYKCKNCDETKTENIPPEHKWNSNGIVTKEPSCTLAGIRTYKCKDCDETKTENIPPEHKWNSNGVVKKEASFFEPGEKEYTCTNPSCQETKIEKTCRLFCDTPIDFETMQEATKESLKIYFGDFPQAKVKKSIDGTIIYGKDKTTVITIDESNSITMGAYTYYIGSDGEYYYKELRDNNIEYFLVEPIIWERLKTVVNGDDCDIVGDKNGKQPCSFLSEKIITRMPYYSYSENDQYYYWDCLKYYYKDFSGISMDIMIGEIVLDSPGEYDRIKYHLWNPDILDDPNFNENLFYQDDPDYMFEITKFQNIGNGFIRIIDGKKIYPNNYKYSQIRAYLNGLIYYYGESENNIISKTDYYDNEHKKGMGFLQTAFTDIAQQKIENTIVRNGGHTADFVEYESGTPNGITTYMLKSVPLFSRISENYICEDTMDKIFLICHSLSIIPEQFIGNINSKISTDFSERDDFNRYWERSPSPIGRSSAYTCFIQCASCASVGGGELIVDDYETYSSNVSEKNGVVPAFTILLE